MNIGSIKKNDDGIFVGRITTLTIAITIALRELHSLNPRAPKYEVMALSQSRAWVRVGALFELFSTKDGSAFLNGNIEDPSLAVPLYLSAFQQDDGSYNLVWSRPTRRRDLAAEMAPKADEGLPPLPGADEAPAEPQDGLGQSSAGHAFGKPQPDPVTGVGGEPENQMDDASASDRAGRQQRKQKATEPA